MRALRYDGRQITLDTRLDEPAPPPGEALIRPIRVGISEADLSICRGLVPFEGVLGHEFVGVVEAVNPGAGRDAGRDLAGARVVGSINAACRRCDLCRAGLSNHCRNRTVLGVSGRDGCLADRFVLPVGNLAKVPDAIDDDAAVFAHPLAAAIHAAQSIRIEGKPFISILGDTPLGLLTVQVMARLNASVRLLGMHPDKFSLCEKWGVKHRHVREVGRRQDQDVVVDCSGDRDGLALAMQMVRPRGTILLMAAPAPIPMPPSTQLDAAEDPNWLTGVCLSPIVTGELEVIGSRCGRVADALEALSRSEVDVLPLITKRMKLDDGAAVVHAAAEPEQIKVVVDV